MTKEQELLMLCQAFINKHNIWGDEMIYQTDKVIEDAYEFIEDICKIVGYIELDNE